MVFMKSYRQLPFVTLLLLLFINAASSGAATIFSTIGESGSYDATSGWGVGVGGPIAVAFTPSETLALDSLSVAAFTFIGPSPLTVYLAEDVSGPGNPIESYEFMLPGGGWMSSSIYTAASSIHPVFQKGLKYWIVWSVDNRIKSAVIANMNAQNIYGDFYYMSDNVWYSYGQQELPALAISGSPVNTASVPAMSGVSVAAMIFILAFVLFHKGQQIERKEA